MFPHYYITHPHNRQQAVGRNTVEEHSMERNKGHNTAVEHSMEVEEHSMHNMGRNMRNTGHNTAVEHSMERNIPHLHKECVVELGL